MYAIPKKSLEHRRPSCWVLLPELPPKQKEDLADAAEQNEENVPSDPRRQPFCYSVLGRWLLVVELCALVGLGNCVNLAGYVGN